MGVPIDFFVDLTLHRKAFFLLSLSILLSFIIPVRGVRLVLLEMQQNGHNRARKRRNDSLFILDDDDDDDLNLTLSLLLDDDTRATKWRNKRIDWREHLDRERHTGKFQSKYHMSEESFDRLVDLLRPYVTVDYKKSMNSTSGNSPIYPEIVVGIGLRYLGGEKIKSLEDIFDLFRKHTAFVVWIERSQKVAIFVTDVHSVQIVGFQIVFSNKFFHLQYKGLQFSAFET